MPSRLFRARWLIAAVALTAVVTGGLAYAAIPDPGGVIHSCYTKSSGAWRVIDTDAGQSCKTNEAALDLYSKGAADLAFLDKPEADALYLGKTQKAADSDKLDGFDSFRYLKGLDALILTDFNRLADGATGFLGHPAAGSYPGVFFDLACDTDGGTTLTVRSPQEFAWWWDDTSGDTGHTPPYEHTFPIGNGVERHSFRGMHTIAWYTTTLDIDTTIGLDPLVQAPTCTVGWTLLKSENDSPGP